MTKYAVLSSLNFSTPALRDGLADAVLTRIGNKPVWGTVAIGKGLDKEDGKPQCSLEVRFDKRADMDDLFAFIKARMDAIPVLTGSVSIHECSHDEQAKPCVISDKYEK